MTENKKIRLLLITDHFPPEQSGGSGRSESLYRYLPELGIEVFVITVDSYGEIGNEKSVFRYQSFIGCSKKPLSRKFAAKIPAKIRSYFTINSDDWWICSVLNDLDKIFQLNCDIVYASYPSISALIIGAKLSDKLNIPLISEFRDGMCFDPVEEIKTKLKLGNFKRMEAKIVNQSVALVTIGDSLSYYFRSQYEHKEVFTVNNGFNSDDFITDEQIHKNGSEENIIKFVHFGSIGASRARDISPIFKAISELASENKISSSKFSLDFIGNSLPKEKNNSIRYNVTPFVNYIEHIPKQQGFSLIKQNYDYLVFYGMENRPTIISSKLPEYLNIGKPILGICKGNDAEKIIEETGTGEICGFSVEEIKKCFIKFINRQVSYNPDVLKISSFDRSKQAGQIAKIIQKAVQNGK